MNKKNDLEALEPLPYEKRGCTDFCWVILSCGLTLVLLIISMFIFNEENYYKSSFPTASDGTVCSIETPNYPYVYFANLPKIDRRVCVAQCPIQLDIALQCKPTVGIGCKFNNNPMFLVQFYESEPVESYEHGMMCLPKDTEERQQLFRDAGLNSRNKFYDSVSTILLSLFVSFAFSIAYFIAVQFQPQIMVELSMIFGGLMILTVMICSCTYPGVTVFQIVMFVMLLGILFLIILVSYFLKQNSRKIHKIFMRAATKIIWEDLKVLLVIPLFILLLFGFAVLVLWEMTSWWTSGNLQFDNDESIYYEFQPVSTSLTTTLFVIYALWGLATIKQAFNFIVSSFAIEWYLFLNDEDRKTELNPFKVLVMKHLGTVIAGAFMTAFFSIGDYIFDLIKPKNSASGLYADCFNFCCIYMSDLFDLVRSDAMGFTYLTGSNYCVSSRYCSYITSQCFQVNDSQSTSRSYRICAHFLIAGIMGIFSLYVQSNISLYALAIIMVQTLFLSTMFIGIHADMAQAIQTVILTKEETTRQELAKGKLDKDHTIGIQDLSHEMRIRALSIPDKILKKINELKPPQSSIE